MPSATVPELDIEIDRAGRFAGLVDNLLEDGSYPGLGWDMIEVAFRMLFTEPPKVEEPPVHRPGNS